MKCLQTIRNANNLSIRVESLPCSSVMSRCLLRWAHAGKRSVTNVKCDVEGFAAIMSIEATVLKVATSTLVRESALLIWISTSWYVLRWRLVVVLAVGCHWHSVHDGISRACNIVNCRLSTLHRQRVQLNGRRNVAGIIFTAYLNAFQLAVRFQRWMLVSSFQDCIFSCRMLSFLDA